LIYRIYTELTASAGQITFTPASYTPGFVDVFRNGVRLHNSDYTATNGSTVVLVNATNAGDNIAVVSFYVSSVLNAIPATAGSIGTLYLGDNSVTSVKIASGAVGNTQLASGAVLANNIGFIQAYGISNATAVTVNSATPTVIAQCTLITTGNPVLIVSCGDMNPTTAADWNFFGVWRDSTQLPKTYIGQTAGSSYNLPFSYQTIDTPSAGSHTYYLKAWQGVGTITYGETGNGEAPTIAVVELI
jgi:hypothetical protein